MSATSRAGHECFCLGGCQLGLVDLIGDGFLFALWQLRDVVEVPHRERLSGVGLLASHLLNFGNDFVVDREELADFTLRFSGQVGNLFLRQIEFVSETSEGVSGFFGTEIGTLPVVDDLIDQHILRVAVLNPAREFFEAEAFGSKEPTAAVDEHVLAGGCVPSNGERLLDTA